MILPNSEVVTVDCIFHFFFVLITFFMGKWTIAD
jgi:hypothetical protein